MIRINKYLASCGISSRRGADKLISENRITVNGKLVEAPGLSVDESGDVVCFDGNEVTPVERKIWIALNKPVGVLTTLNDPFKRKTISDLIGKVPERVYPVGRLDFDTSGLLLLSNDGDLSYRLLHPRYGIRRVYEVIVRGMFQPADSARIRRGVTLEDGAVGKGEVEILRSGQKISHIRLTLKEGRKREVRQLCRAVGHRVQKLTRVQFANINLGTLKSGSWRNLSAPEVRRLRILVKLDA